jgi:hypothetical protein
MDGHRAGLVAAPRLEMGTLRLEVASGSNNARNIFATG